MSGSRGPFTLSRSYRLDLTAHIPLDAADRTSLLRKLDIAARAEVLARLRTGEVFRSAGSGIYELMFPRLVAAAAERRFAELATEVRARLAGGHLGARGGEIAAAEPVRMPATAFPEPDTLPFGGTPALAELNLQFHPVWNVANNHITGYRCVLSRRGAPVTPADLDALAGPGPASLIAARGDGLVYRLALAALDGLMRHGAKALLIVPIHFATLEAAPLAVSVFGRATIPPDAARHLVFELIAAPSRLSTLRLRDPVQYLRARSRALVARIDVDVSNVALFRDFHFHGIGLDAAALAWREKKLFAFFEQFAALAERQRLTSFVHGLATTSLSVAAVSAGFTYVDGSAIAPPGEAPGQVEAFAVSRLYA